MGINLRQGYGLTESAPVISMSETVGNHPTTVGKPLPGIEVKLGANDELLVRGPQVMEGLLAPSGRHEGNLHGGWFPEDR